MNMYQKRKMRKEKKINENGNNERVNSAGISWFPRTYGQNNK